MGFEKITKRLSGPNQFSVDTVRLSCSGKQVEFCMSADIWRAMGEPNRVGFAIGTGRDAGKVMLEFDDDDGYACAKAHARAEARKVAISRAKLKVANFQTVAAEHSMEGSRLIVTLPKGVRLSDEVSA